MRVASPQTSQDSKFSFDDNTITISGYFTIRNCGSFVPDVLAYFHNKAAENIRIDLSKLQQIDSAGSTSIYYLQRELAKKGINSHLSGASAEIEAKMKLLTISDEVPTEAKEKPSFFFRAGENTHALVSNYIKKFISFASELFYWTIADIFKTKQRRRGAVANQAVIIGVNAVPIVTVMAFIIGLVLALQSASQLRNFGANIFIVDLTVIAMLAEMGPLITAVIVAGRSGSAIAAEIATMKVTNELDALQTMGFNPIRFVVVPKIYGSLITMPFLTTLANVFGIIGGIVAAYLYLDISPEIFFHRMSGAIYQKDILTGLVKSFVYGSIVVVTGSFFGFQVDKGAEGVGKSTTQSVVAAIALVIVADLVLGLIFY